MAHSKNFGWVQLPITVAACLILDYLSKRWAEANLPTMEYRPLIEGFINLKRTTNTGAAFSIGEDHSAMMTVFASIITLVILIWCINRERSEVKPHMVERIGTGCILGGALGNLFDRFNRGEVTDFLEFSFFDFPIFNVADILINVGLGLFILYNLFMLKEESKPKPGTIDE